MASAARCITGTARSRSSSITRAVGAWRHGRHHAIFLVAHRHRHRAHAAHELLVVDADAAREALQLFLQLLGPGQRARRVARQGQPRHHPRAFQPAHRGQEQLAAGCAMHGHVAAHREDQPQRLGGFDAFHVDDAVAVAVGCRSLPACRPAAPAPLGRRACRPRRAAWPAPARRPEAPARSRARPAWRRRSRRAASRPAAASGWSWAWPGAAPAGPAWADAGPGQMVQHMQGAQAARLLQPRPGVLVLAVPDAAIGAVPRCCTAILKPKPHVLFHFPPRAPIALGPARALPRIASSLAGRARAANPASI